MFENPLKSEELLQREHPRTPDMRGDYFRDTTAILHSYPFRRLKHKTQVFFSPKNDHICTRIEHVMHVASVATTICRGLGLNGDLAWAIGLGHDLGHTPFGHTGERVIAKLAADASSSCTPAADASSATNPTAAKSAAGFHHELFSLRVVDFLADYGEGLNLTYATRDGIVSHCGERFDQSITPDFTIKPLKELTKLTHVPATWEGAVVRVADRIAYVGRDLEDAISLGLVRAKDIPETTQRVLGKSNREIINTLVQDLHHTSLETGCIGFSDLVYQGMQDLITWNYQHIYKHDLLEECKSYFTRILTQLHSYLTDIFAAFGTDKEKYSQEHNHLAQRFGAYVQRMEQAYLRYDGNFDWVVIDYIAGMSDNYAMDSAAEIMFPRELEGRLDQLMKDRVRSER